MAAGRHNAYQRLFRGETSFDFAGRWRRWLAISGVIIIAGLISLATRGLNFSIDFKGGTVVYVRFAGKPPVDQLRSGLAQQGLGESVIQQISDISNPNANDVVIYLPQHGEGNEALDAGVKRLSAFNS